MLSAWNRFPSLRSTGLMPALALTHTSAGEVSVHQVQSLGHAPSVRCDSTGRACPLSWVLAQVPPPPSSTRQLFSEHCVNRLRIDPFVRATVLSPRSITNSTNIPEQQLCELTKVRIGSVLDCEAAGHMGHAWELLTQQHSTAITPTDLRGAVAPKGGRTTAFSKSMFD